MDRKSRIISDPQAIHGPAWFAGTRVPVSVVLDNLNDGEPVELILGQYPSLMPAHIPAASSYAADLARERIVSLPA